MLLVEDEPLLSAQLVALFGEQQDLQVIAAYATGEEAVAHTEPFDLAVVDLRLPGMSGVDVIRVLRERWPDADMLAHTVFEDKETVFDALVAGATGYILKGASAPELLAAVRGLRDGGAPMSPRIARFVVGAFQRQQAVADQYRLSARERQVLRHIEEGLSYKEVGTALSVSTHTVHTHIKRIYEKLQAHSKKEALAKAKLRGIL
jgi:two-component system NarL family response regulator